MALAVLGIIYVVIIIAVLVMQVLLYKSHEDSSNINIIFGINMLIGIALSVMAFTSLPSNYVIQRVFAVVWGILAVLGMIINLKRKDLLLISKLLLTTSIIGSLAQLFL